MRNESRTPGAPIRVRTMETRPTTTSDATPMPTTIHPSPRGAGYSAQSTVSVATPSTMPSPPASARASAGERLAMAPQHGHRRGRVQTSPGTPIARQDAALWLHAESRPAPHGFGQLRRRDVRQVGARDLKRDVVEFAHTARLT